MADVDGAKKDSAGDITNIAAGNITDNSGMVAVGTNITQIADADLPYKVGGLDNPYLGLAPYTYASHTIYDGRKAQIERAVSLITAAPPLPLLFVIGASGAGKSSFVQAGLVPALESYYQAEHRTFRSAALTPGPNPLASLCGALAKLGLTDQYPDEFEASLNSPQAITAFLSATPRGQVNLLLLDQFEELLTQSDKEGRDLLLTLLSALPPFSVSHSHIVLTIRSDFLPRLFDELPALDEISTKARVPLRVMSKPELEDAIQKPVQVMYGDRDKRFEPDLLECLAEDASKDATYLPLLQVTLEELWRGGLLKRSRYHDLTTAISKRADEVLTRKGDNPRPQEEQE